MMRLAFFRPLLGDTYPQLIRRVLKAFAVSCVLSLSVFQAASAYTNEWEWRIYGLWDTGNMQWVSGIQPGSYASKEAAVAAMQAAFSPLSQQLTQDAGEASMSSSGWIRHEFRPITVTPTFSDWTLLYYASEQEFLDQIWETYGGCSTGASVNLVHDWMTSPTWQWGSQEIQSKEWAVTSECIGASGLLVYIQRVRNISCPQPWGLGTVPNKCGEIQLQGYVEGRPLECPSTGPSQTPGNPCDVTNGDKTQSETDYSGNNLSFTRTYHSKTLPATAGAGQGWTHNFAGKLLFSGSTPTGLVRPRGYVEQLYLASGAYISLSGSGTRVAQVGTQWVATLSNGSEEIYSSTGRLEQLKDAAGRTTTLSYTNNRVSLITGPFGHTLQLAYTNGLLASVVDPAGQSIAYEYTNGNLTKVTYQDTSFRVYHYENTTFPHHLTGITDENGNRYSTYAYDATGRAQSSQHAGGAGLISLVYNSSSTEVTDAAGAVTTYAFTSDANVPRRITSVSKNGLTHSYASSDSYGPRRVTEEADPRGIITEYTYDRDHVLSKTEASGTLNERTTTYAYSSSATDLPTLITRPGQTTAFSYDSFGNILSRTITDTATAEARTWTYTYDSYGRVLTEDGPRTDVIDITEYIYYTCTIGAQCGQFYQIENPLSQLTTFNTYNAHGQPLTITDANGVVTTLTYDLRQHLTSRTVGSEATTFAYWPNGLLKKVTSPDGSYLNYTYDDAQRLVRVDDSEGNYVAYTLDGMGNRTLENSYDPTNALSRTHSRVYNALNQLWKDVGAAGTSSVTTVFGYDDNGNQASIDAPLGRSNNQLYDELNRLVEVTDALNGSTQYVYNDKDRVTSVADPRGLFTTYDYNAFGDLLYEDSPDAGGTEHTYDPAGNLSTSFDAEGVTTTRTYDALNRLKTISYESGGDTDLTTNFRYDIGTYGKGHLTDTWDQAHESTWRHDALGRVVDRSQKQGGVTKEWSYGYTNGNRTSLVTPSGQSVVYGYTNGRVTSISVNGTTILSGVLYEPFGPVRQWTWGNTTLAVRTHDQDGRITQIDSKELLTYSYDNANRITAIANTSNSALSWTYGYDALDRLTSAQKGSTTPWTWTYDANGNRLTQGGNEATSYTYSSTSNRLSSGSGDWNRSYTYDAAGNTTGYDIVSLETYNSGRLKRSTLGTAASSMYYYDAFGRMIMREGGGLPRILFYYDEEDHLIGEYNSTGALVQETVWLGDIPVAALRPNGSGVDIFYVHTDHLNTPLMITRPSDNKLRWRWDRGPFGRGQTYNNPESLGAFNYNLRFPGQYYLDEVWGLYYNMARVYDPDTGRYQQSDPIGLAGGINTYAYVENNPLRYTDPNGLMKLPSDPSGLPPGWTPDPSHKDPNGERWRHPSGDYVDFHKGRKDAPGWRGRDHWHHNGGKDHHSPGDEVPDPPGSEPACGDNCQNKVATVVVGAAGAYVVYRCVRMIPSLFPPLWPTIPLNVVTP